MKSTRSVFLLIAIACIALLGAAVYYQIVEEMAPCPWCVIQRYIFAGIAIVSLILAFSPEKFHRIGLIITGILALFGTAAAFWLIWVQAHPGLSCGIDPMETALNQYPTAKWFPTLFEANGFCTTLYDDVFGLSIPQWSSAAFIVITIVSFVTLYKKLK